MNVYTDKGRVFSTGYGESFALGHKNNITKTCFEEVKGFSPEIQNNPDTDENDSNVKTNS